MTPYPITTYAEAVTYTVNKEKIGAFQTFNKDPI